MDIPLIGVTLILITIISLYLGSILSLRLPYINKHFDRKPFNCRPCLTFHLDWFLSALFSFVWGSVELFAIGVVAAFVVFFIVKYIDHKKIIE